MPDEIKIDIEIAQEAKSNFETVAEEVRKATRQLERADEHIGTWEGEAGTALKKALTSGIDKLKDHATSIANYGILIKAASDSLESADEGEAKKIRSGKGTYEHSTTYEYEYKNGQGHKSDPKRNRTKKMTIDEDE